MENNDVVNDLKIVTEIDKRDTVKVAAFIQVLVDNYPECVSEKQKNLLIVCSKILAGVASKL